MKTRFKGIVTFLLILLAVPLTSWARLVENNGINFDVYDSTETATVVRKDGGYSGDIVIPSWIIDSGLQYSVTTIDGGAFANSTGMTSVTIPNTITTIGHSAFHSCSGLTSVTIPNSVTSISDWAFAYCSGLTSLTIPGSVTSIGAAAFQDCSGLTSVTIPGDTSIGNDAFYNCHNLKYADFESIESLCQIKFGSETANPLYYAHKLYIAKEQVTELVIPNTVTSIGDYAFTGGSSLTSVTIPNSVTSIGADAFHNCSGLPSVTIPESVTSIGARAFGGCTGLSSVTIPNSVTSIGENAFWDCTGLTSVTLPNSLTTISGGLFSVCTGLKSVTIPNSVTSIGVGAFYECGLTSVIIPNSVTTIGREAFNDCESLTSVSIPSSVTSLGDGVFMNCRNLRWVAIGNPNLELPERTFSLDSYLGQIPEILFCPVDFEWNGSDETKIVRFDPETTEFLEDGTVVTDNGKKLLAVPNPGYRGTSYTIPDGIEVIGEYAFYWSSYEGSDLESLTIPASLKSIEANAFEHISIDKVNFVDWTKWYTDVELGNFYSLPYRNGAPYAGGMKITTTELKEGMTEVPDYKNYGLQFKDEVDLPTTIKRIGAYAFYNNKELYHVFLPEGLEEIGEYAFAECDLLENPSFPAGLKKIEHAAYYKCPKITEIVLPSGLSYLGEMISKDEWNPYGWFDYRGIFEDCTALEKAVIVCDIDYLDNMLFKGCTSLQTLFLPLQLKTIGDYALANTGLDEITFPATLESIGEYAVSGGKITHLVIPNSVTSMGEGAFQGQAITNLTLGTGLTSIPKRAFAENNLAIINFAYGLVEIGEEAFAGGWMNKYSTISVVNLPSTVTTIGANAFANNSICEMNVPDKVLSLPAGSCGNPSVLNLGSGIKNIDADAFSFDKLYTIRLKANTPPTLSDAFPLTDEQNDQLTLIVNTERRPYYVTNARWKQIARIVEDGATEADIYMTGDYSLASEIRTTTGLMPAAVTKMKVEGPLKEEDLLTMQRNMPALTSLDLQKVTNVTAIPAGLLEGSLITEIILPANLESIGDNAFANCRMLQINELPATLKTIGNSAFAGAVRVQLPEFPVSLESIGSYAFANTAMQEFIAPESLKTMGSGAFEGCYLLERADLSASALTEVEASAFLNCTELDEVILSESVKAIGTSAFSGTALRNIDFCNDVTTIAGGAFSNNRRLVAATLPKAIKAVEASIFSNCPRLLAVSMPKTTTNVGEAILNGDRKLSNISCAAIEAPETEKNTFTGLRMRYVSLIIPRQSFRSYLDALGWGSFETIKNTIPVEIDEGVEASTVSEEEYQDMLELDALEQAEEDASKEESPAAAAKAARRAKARANTPQYFASLFNGAQIQTGDEDSGMRVFINPKEDVTITSILFEEEELLPEFLQNHSILLKKGCKGTLKIMTDAKAALPDVKLNLEVAEVNEGGTVQLSATTTPEDAQVTWTSSDETIATVDQTGLVTAIKAGKVTITAKTADAEASCEITVKAAPVQSSLTLNIEEAELSEGESIQLSATTTPEDAQVTWTSSDETIATVDQTGLVTAVKAGKVTITAKTADAEASCVITVKAGSGIDGIDADSEVSVIAYHGAIIVTAPENAVVEVYTISGQLVNQTTEHRIEGLNSGFYLVRVGNANFKVVL